MLFSEPWLGKPDFLRRVEVPSDFGDWSYEVVDTKLAREAKAGAVLQITFYTDLLARVQGVEPEEMVLALGGPDEHPGWFQYTDFAAFYRSVRTLHHLRVEGPLRWRAPRRRPPLPRGWHHPQAASATDRAFC